MSFLREMTRRKVFQVATVYAVVAWLLVQIVATVEVPLSLPDWFDTVAIVLLALGFPIAVILAWAFDLTAQGIRSESDPRIQENLIPVHAGGQWPNYILQGLVLIAVGFLVIDQYVLERGVAVRGEDGSASLSTAASVNVKRTEINLGVTESLGDTGLGAQVTLSRDGRRIAYAAQVDSTSQLYLRNLDQLEARLIPGTQGARNPFFSPDGEWLGFYDEQEGILKKVSVDGGAPQALADATFASGGSWMSDDTIVFGTGDSTTGRKLFRVSATGGAPEILVPPGPETGHGHPDVLPGSDAVLLAVRPGIGGNGPARAGHIALLSLATNELRTLIEPGHAPRYSPTGHVLFVRAGDLWAVPFDAQRLETTGPEVRVIAGVQQDGHFGSAAYAISGDGMLVYLPGGDMAVEGQNTSLKWVDRDGREEPLDLEPSLYMGPQLSPDGERVAAVLRTETEIGDILIIDLMTNTRSRLTSGQGPHYYPRWTPDGESLVYWWGPPDEEAGGLFRQAADGTGRPERLTVSGSSFQIPHSFADDGSWMVFEHTTPNDDLYLMSLDEGTEPQPLLNGPYDETDAVISPDERWIAYASDETGRFEIYVRPFPNVNGGSWQISDRGGIEPLWSPDGSELFFRSGAGFFSVSIRSEGAAIARGTPEEMFTGVYKDDPGAAPNYDISLDGQRFLVIDESNRSSEQAVLVAIENWFEELDRLAPPAEQPP